MAKRARENSISNTTSLNDQSGHGAGLLVHPTKIAQVDAPDGRTVAMQCSLPPHGTLIFKSYTDYETHYIKSHANRCSDCAKNFPSAHFLNLHFEEYHDPIIALKREQGGKTFSCFVEGCDKVCNDWQKRRSHLVDKHCFPKNYDFFVVKSGIDGRRSMLRAGIDSQGHRRSSRDRRGSSATLDTQTTEATSVSQQSNESDQAGAVPDDVLEVGESAESQDAPLDAVTNSMSSLQFVPRSVTFGRRKGRSGLAKS